MPGIIFSVASGVNESVFGEIQSPLKVLVERENEAWMSKDMNLAPKIFLPFNLDTHSGTIQSMGSMGEMEAVGENGEYPLGEVQEGFRKILTSDEWKYSVSISQSAMEDKLDVVLKNQAQDLMDAYHRTRNNFFWGLLGAAIKNQHYVRKGKTFSVDTMDGVKLFSKAHPSKFDPKLKQSNAFADAFSAEALDRISTIMQNMMTDNGEVAGLNPDTIIIPNIAAAKREVFGVIGAYNDPSTQAGNKFNYLFGNWNVMVVPWLVPYCGANGSFPWIIMDSEYNAKRYGAVDVQRVAPTVSSYIDNGTDANIWKLRTRFSGAFGDWRAFCAGGLEFGSEV